MASQSPFESRAVDNPSSNGMCLERLPLELLQSILSELDGISSLDSAVLTCRKLWKAGTSSQVVKNVLFGQLDNHHVRSQAIATWKIRQLPKPAPRQEFLKHLDSFLTSDNQCASTLSLTIKDANEIEQLNLTVCDLTASLIHDCIEGDYLRDSDPNAETPASSAEEIRIQRAFYLAETYYTLFQSPSDDRSNSLMQVEDFWSRLAAWEIEILACIHNFLFRQVAQALHEYLLDNVDLLKSQRKLARAYGVEIVNRMLCKGLQLIHRNFLSDSRGPWSILLKDDVKQHFESWTMSELVCPLISRRGLAYICEPPFWMVSSPEEDSTMSAPNCLSDLEHIYLQTDSTRDQSPFVPPDTGLDSLIIEEGLELFGVMRATDDMVSRVAEQTRLYRWGYALWDWERDMAPDEDVPTGYDWPMKLLRSEALHAEMEYEDALRHSEE